MTIAPKTVSLAASKTYDGTTDLTGKVTITTGVGSETLSYSGATANDSHVATTSKFINAITLANATDTSGGLASNFQLPTLDATTAALTIAAKTVALSASKTYDGGTSLTGTNVTIDTGITGQALNYTGATISSKNVADNATNAISAITLTNGTGTASDYTLPTLNHTNAAVTIAPKTLVASVTILDKVYNGNTTATPILSVTAGLVDGETISAIGTATFNSKDVATANQVTVNSVTLTNGSNGGLASNYSLPSGDKVTAHITPKTLVASVSILDKVYNGDTTATPILSVTSGLVDGETISATGTATFNSKDIATANLVTVNSTTLADGTNGGMASNYILPSGKTVAGTITRLSEVTWVGGTTGDWSNPVNWAGGAIPTRDNVARVVIPATVNPVFGPGLDQPVLLDSLSGGGLKITSGTLDVSQMSQLTRLNQTDGTLKGTGKLTVTDSFIQSGGRISIGGDATIHQVQGNLTVTSLLAKTIDISTAAGDVILSNVGSTSTTNIQSSGSISQTPTGTLTVLGDLVASAGTDVVLDAARNRFAGKVSISGRNITLTEGAGPLTLGDTRASGDLKIVTTQGEITQAKDSSAVVAGTTSVNASKDGSPQIIHLNSANNQFDKAVSLTGSDIQISQASKPLVLGAINSAGNLDVSSAGPVSQIAAVSASGGTSITATGKSVDLAHPDNALGGPLKVKAASLNLVAGKGELLLSDMEVTGEAHLSSTAGPVRQVSGAQLYFGGPSSIKASLQNIPTSVSLIKSAVNAPKGLIINSEVTQTKEQVIDVQVAVTTNHLVKPVAVQPSQIPAAPRPSVNDTGITLAANSKILPWAFGVSDGHPWLEPLVSEGRSFELPLAQLADQTSARMVHTPSVVRTVDGGELPSWLEFNTTTNTLQSKNVPAQALPLVLTVEVDGATWMLRLVAGQK